SICSFFMDEEVLTSHNFEKDNVLVFILYTCLLCPFLLLTLKLKPVTSIRQIPNQTYLEVLMIFFGIGALFSVIYLFPYTQKALLMSAKEVRSQVDVDILPP